MSTRIEDVQAAWLHCPIPPEQQHVSDFGRITAFDACWITITTEDGRQGFGEAKAAVGSSGACGTLVALIRDELAPALRGRDPRAIHQIAALLYNGPRAGYAAARGRNFPVLARRGLLVAAASGIDLALWDHLGRSLEVPVLDLLGGPCRDRMPAYASGGWAPVESIGEQLRGYVARGHGAVKMRVGVMDGTVTRSVARVRAARAALGPDVQIMVDAHGTYSTAEARAFAAAVTDLDLRWFEEPVSADNREGLAEVRRSSPVPIAAGESECTVFDFHDLVRRRAVDVLQPDLAICGGLTEGLRISSLAVAEQLELAPHCWGSALSFQAGLTLAFASPAASLIEYALGGNPLLRELPEETIAPATDGTFGPPRGPGLGVTPRRDFLERYTRSS